MLLRVILVGTNVLHLGGNPSTHMFQKPNSLNPVN